MQITPALIIMGIKLIAWLLKTDPLDLIEDSKEKLKKQREAKNENTD
jgi:hypothetical protein